MKKTGTEMEKQEAAADPPSAAEPLVPLAAATLAPEQLEELKERAAKADEHWERLLRTAADLENFKKRAAREKQDAIKSANEALLRKLIPVLDHFEMALSATQSAQAGAGPSPGAATSEKPR